MTHEIYNTHTYDTYIHLRYVCDKKKLNFKMKEVLFSGLELYKFFEAVKNKFTLFLQSTRTTLKAMNATQISNE